MIEYFNKRLSLLSLLLFIPPIIWYDILFNYYYLTPCSVIIIFTILWNFPYIASSLHTKPLYLCDLTGNDLDIVIKDEEQRKIFTEIKDNYVFTFNIILAIFTSLAFGALSDIWIYKTKGKEDLPEIIGITGGILSIYSKFQTYIGYLLLTIFVKLKKDREKQFCTGISIDNKKKSIIEMETFHNTSEMDNIIVTNTNQNQNVIQEIKIKNKEESPKNIQKRKNNI